MPRGETNRCHHSKRTERRFLCSQLTVPFCVTVSDGRKFRIPSELGLRQAEGTARPPARWPALSISKGPAGEGRQTKPGRTVFTMINFIA